METKTALITGITGQDGSFLSELLIKKGYDVYGLIRRLSSPNLNNIQHLVEDDSITLIGGDLADQSSIMNTINVSNPEEIYHLGAQSFVGESWKQAELTSNITGLGTLRVLESVKLINKNIKIYHASSSEQFGNIPAPQNEESKMVPRSPYGVAKIFAHNMAIVYRESYEMFVDCGILFNHESPRRGIEFVSMKIANAVAKIDAGFQDKLKLGNLDAMRDWGYSKDYVEAMWLMLQKEKPDDFVIASGESHTVKEFVDKAFSYVDLEWQDYVEIDNSLMRPAEIYDLRGNYDKAKRILGWEPKTTFEDIIRIMVDSEIRKING